MQTIELSNPSKPLPKCLTDVSCPHCRKYLEACPRNKNGYPQASEVYQGIGNMAKSIMGHATFFTKTGTIALCIARFKKED